MILCVCKENSEFDIYINEEVRSLINRQCATKTEQRV